MQHQLNLSKIFPLVIIAVISATLSSCSYADENKNENKNTININNGALTSHPTNTSTVSPTHPSTNTSTVSPTPSPTNTPRSSSTSQPQNTNNKGNVITIIDNSGSMDEYFDGNTGTNKLSKMDAAKEAAKNVVRNMQPYRNMGLVVFGGSDCEDKPQKLVQLGDNISVKDFSSQIDKIQTYTYTPLGKTIEEVGNEVKKLNKKVTIVVVSDGLDTCGSDPIQVVKKLKESNIEVIFNIIGVGVTDEDKKYLKRLADAGKGKYYDAKDPKGVNEAVENAVGEPGKFKIDKPNNPEVKGWEIYIEGEKEKGLKPVFSLKQVGPNDDRPWQDQKLPSGQYDVYYIEGPKDELKGPNKLVIERKASN